ncbi:MAG TPA: acetyl-CoA C-acyltransferase [Thermoanaerobaculia bacterium]
MQEIVILSAARTPIGAFQGALSSLTAPQLGARALAGAIERAGLTPQDLDQVYMGCVLQAGLGQAPARQAALGAGCPPTTGAVTVHKVCGSGMRAMMSAANDLRCGDYALVAAGGMEAMSRAPYLVPGARDGLRLGHARLIDAMIHDGLWDPYGDKHMGSCAETCAARYGFSREDQDAYAKESYRRAQAAQEAGLFDPEIVPVEVPRRRGEPLRVDRDEEPGRADFDKMAQLKPAFQKDGTVTAANASKINDGAAALVLTTAEHAARLGKEPVARLLAQASFAHEPEWFTTAPIEAVRRVLDRAGLTLADVDLFEVNEAFAAVAMAARDELGIDPERLNVRGGAVALGHPIGASGARIVVTLLHALAERGARRGCAAICLGGGEATAVVVERL